MVIPRSGRVVQQSEVPALNDAAAFDSARDYALRLERFARSKGMNVGEARRWCAREGRVGVGTFENIVRNRVKTVDEKIRDKLAKLVVKLWRAEIARLNRELETIETVGGQLAREHREEVEACLARAHTILRRYGGEQRRVA